VEVNNLPLQGIWHRLFSII